MLRSFALALIVCLLFLPVRAAQSITGILVGRVIDHMDAPLPGVLIRITHLNTGFLYAKRTDTEGNYRVDFLPAGEYSITAEKDGYKSASIPRFVAEVNREKVIKPPPIQLYPINQPTPAPANPTTVGVLQANVSDGALRGNATAEFITALPLAGIRSFDTFALLVPGVAPPPATLGANGPGIGSGVGTAGQFSVNGQRARANNFTIDGSDNNDQDVGVRRQGFTPTIPQSVESITEFQITTLLSNAEAGRNTGGQINVVSRSGSNEVHGEFYNYFSDSALNARDFFDLGGVDNPSKNPFTRNQLGGTIAFPLIRNRLQVFGAYEQQAVNRVQESHFVVPTQEQRDRSLGVAQGFSALGSDILQSSFYPLPNNAGGPYADNTLTRILPATGQGTIFAIKTDYQFRFYGKTSTFTSRYNFTDDDTRIAAVDNAINASITALTRTENFALALSTELSTRLANQIRFSYGRTSLAFREVPGSPLIFQSQPRGTDINVDGIVDGRTGPIGRLLLAPFSPIGIDPSTFPQGRTNNTFQIADTFALTHGSHSLKLGVDIRRVQINSFLDRNYRAQISFTAGFLGDETSKLEIGNGVDFAALGVPSDIFQALALVPDSTLGLRFTELNLFAHEQYRIHPNVTLEFGLRYERNSVPKDASGRLERSITLSDSQLPPFNSDTPLSKRFFDALAAQRQFLAGRTKIYSGDNNNFAPRLGFAWDLSKTGRMALRGGYGLFYDPILGTIVSQSRNAFPNFIPINFSSGRLFDQVLAANPAFIRFGDDLSIPLIQPGTVNTIGLPANQFIPRIGQLLQLGELITGGGFGAGVTLPIQNLRTPYVQQYSLSLERVFLDRYTATLSYAGASGRKLIRVRTPNGGPFSTGAVRFVQDLDPIVLSLLKRPNSLLGAVTVFESSANSSYHALQASLVRRFTYGLALQVAYTYAHAIDEVSDVFDLAGSFALAQDELGRNEGLRAERGNASFDVRHRFTSAWQYELPFLRQHRWFGGFQLAGILTLQTGQPFTVNSSVDVNLDGNLSDRLDTVKGLIISDQGRTRIRLAPGTRPVDLIARADMDNPPNGQLGRNTFRAAGIAALDLALIKRFVLSERQAVALRMEVFNAFNRTHFGTPIRVLESPGFGSSVNTALPARTFQLAVRYSF
ncbi:MAG: carboxypeptidase-like regulatory domain-containing protein [Acidobacteriota bacterium]